MRARFSRYRHGGTLATLLILFVLVLGACSAGSSGANGLNLSLGLAGSTADHPAKPPKVATSAPSGTLAFVYDNQVWLDDGSGAKQLTHLVLSNGATITWGPLVWSPDGTYLAFALAQGSSTSNGQAVTGPIYYVDTASGSTTVTTATGSIYGHSYTWYGNDFLVYSAGSAINMFGPISTGDPRVWAVLSPFNSNGANNTSPDGGFVRYGDLTITRQNMLFFTRMSLTALGATTKAGTAALDYARMPLPPTDITPTDLANPNYYPIGPYNYTRAADLGQVYTGPSGIYTAGAWQISAGGTYLVTQNVTSVDAKSHAVTSSYCAATINYGYSNCIPLFKAAAKTSSTIPATISISPDGTAAALTSKNLYIENTDGTGSARLGNAGWTTPPAWSPDSKAVAVTRLNKATTDANGVTRFDTTVVLSTDSSTGTTLIAGAQNLSWKP
jgi:hypothetical protein